MVSYLEVFAMETNESCPLDGSWLRSHCTTYENQKEKGTLANCQHRVSCSHVRTVVESDANESVSTAKKVLIGQIPSIFKKEIGRAHV